MLFLMRECIGTGAMESMRARMYTVHLHFITSLIKNSVVYHFSVSQKVTLDGAVAAGLANLCWYRCGGCRASKPVFVHTKPGYDFSVSKNVTLDGGANLCW